MAKKLTGSISRAPDGSTLRIRITHTDDKGTKRRPWLHINPSIDDVTAKKVAAKVSEELQGKPFRTELFKHANGPGLTVSRYFETLWAPSRSGKVRSLRSDRYRFKKHVADVVVGSDKVPLGEKLMVNVTSDDLRDLVQALDKKAATLSNETGRERFGGKSAINVWAAVSKMFADAVASKQRELRVLTVNPAIGVSPPDAGPAVEKQWLFPSELRQLLECAAVPQAWRRLYAVAVYCYARPGEVLAMLWGRSVDVEHGMVRINRSYDSIEDVVVEHTKTMDSRHFSMEPVLAPLLRAMWLEAGRRPGGTVFPTSGKLAEALRGHLMTAGVKRAALHVQRRGALRMRFHDLRATGITYMAIRGDTDNNIRERAGHADFATTQGYIRRGQLAMGSSIGDPFAPLPRSLIESSGVSSNADSANSPKGANHAGSSGAGEGIRILSPATWDGLIPQNPPESEAKSDRPAGSGTVQDDSRDDSAPLFPHVARAFSDLTVLAQIDPEAARPGLAVCRAFDAMVRGEELETLAVLIEEGVAAEGGGR